MHILKRILILYLGVIPVFFILCSCNRGKIPEGNSELIIFHAGSLSYPFKIMTDSFQKAYPGIHILTESAGSVASARKITELGKKCDILAVADYGVIDEMLIPEYADWNFKFATNEMTIVYNEKSRFASEIGKMPWYEILQKPGVRYGRSDPDADPCGYRTILCLKLAEKHYSFPGLERIITSKHQRYIRPKEVDLLALLESGDIDYVFLYRSVAIQHNLRYVVLPDSINLKDPELTEWYAGVETDIKGNAPGKRRIVKGEPMVYSFCIPKNASNSVAAEKFVRFLTDTAVGIKIMEQYGQPSAIPSSTKSYNQLPSYLKELSKP